jgi:hypothetical protein
MAEEQQGHTKTVGDALSGNTELQAAAGDMFTVPSGDNGLHAYMSEEDLLAELSYETVGESFGYVTLRLSKGDTVKHVRLKIKPVDVMKIGQYVDELPGDVKQRILDGTANARSVGFSDDVWLRALAACVQGLASPHTIKDGQKVVWKADGNSDKQDLPTAMIALAKIGFDYWHINEWSTKVAYLTRGSGEQDFLSNS